MDTFLTYLLTTGVAYLAEMHRCESPRAFLIDHMWTTGTDATGMISRCGRNESLLRLPPGLRLPLQWTSPTVEQCI